MMRLAAGSPLNLQLGLQLSRPSMPSTTTKWQHAYRCLFRGLESSQPGRPEREPVSWFLCVILAAMTVNIRNDDRAMWTS